MANDFFYKHLRVLELHKIAETLSAETSFSDACEQCLNIMPSFDYKTVENLLLQTSDAYSLISRFGSPSFGGAINVNNALERAKSGSVLQCSEFLQIATLLRVMRGVKEWREHFCSNTQNSLTDFFDRLYANKYFEDKIFTSILSEDEVSDKASTALFEIRRKIRSSSAGIRTKLDSMVRSTAYSKYLQESIITQRDGRFVIPVKAEYRSEVAGLIHDTSSSGSTLFIEPMAIVEINNELRVLKQKEKDEIERILASLSLEAAEFADSIKYAYKAVVALDVIFAKAKYAFKIKATVPTLNTDGITVLKNARHPLLKDKAVPISLSLGKDFDTLIITGPNTGGKTVTLKTIGLLTLMAMCGLMIPADDGSVINVYRKIFADIGDEQSIEQSLSTFSSHIKNIVGILKYADSESLVLLDELGAGTDPIEGAALAQSIIAQLRTIGANTVTTTHYAELKAYALNTDDVQNASCEFDVKTLKPTYRLLIGMPGRSNAFAISKKLGISEEIINNASSLIDDENKHFEEVVGALEIAQQTAERERKITEKLRREIEQQKSQIAKSEQDTARQREKILEEARLEAMRIVEKARENSDLLLNSLEDIKKKYNKENSTQMLNKARMLSKKSINDLEKDADYILKNDENYTLPRDIKIGDKVLLADINKEAEVLSLPDKLGKLTVSAGIMKMQTTLDNIRLIQSTAKSKPQKSVAKRNVTGVKSRAERDAVTEIDLRGMASDEALIEVGRFIDSAVLSGISTVRIIHGKGTGVLRKAVQADLKRNKSVRTFRLGVFGEGESGVTIAELKD